MKLYYIVRKEAMNGLSVEWHGQELVDDHMLVVIRWTDEAAELEWSKRTDVEPLPHPLFEPNVPLRDYHIKALATKHPVKLGDTVHDLIHHVSKQFTVFRLHVL